ncbi:MAG: GNAT family N-acetyltransferase [Acidiferrobacterales bacterium]
MMSSTIHSAQTKSIERRSVTLRPIGPDDEAFLCALYASTRAAEMAMVDWDDNQKRIFLEMQFNTQHKFYQEHFANAAFLVIETNGEAIGRLYVDRRDDEIRLLDIALLPQYRNGGLGGALMQELLDEAAAAGKPLRLHVESFNPAQRLYERLGFAKLETNGVYELMEWRPQ